MLIGTKSPSAAPGFRSHAVRPRPKQLLGSGASGAQTCAPQWKPYAWSLHGGPSGRWPPTMAVATCIYLVSPLTYHYVLIPALKWYQCALSGALSGAPSHSQPARRPTVLHNDSFCSN